MSRINKNDPRLEYGNLARYQDKLWMIYCYDEEELPGTVELVPQLFGYDIENATEEQVVIAPLQEIVLIDEKEPSDAYARSFFRLETTPWKTAEEKRMCI